MGNTTTIKNVIVGQKEAVVYFTLASDGSEETNLPVFDSSVVATAAGDTDPLNSAIISVYATVSAAATARAVLRWDATTPVLAMDLPAQNSPVHFSAERWGRIGSLPNQGATGKTGDITLTTTGLEAGDAITIVLHVKRQ